MSDLLYSIFWLPWRLSLMHTKSWLIGGQFGHTLCKLVPFFGDVPMIVSVQNLVLIAVDRFGAVVFPLRSPLIRSKLCPFFISATWIVAAAFIWPHSFTYQLIEYSGEILCEMRWTKAFGESSSVADHILAATILFTYIPVMVLVLLYAIIFIKLKTQAHPGEQSANIQQQRNKLNRNVLHMSIAIVLVFVFCWLPCSTNSLIIGYPTLARPRSMQLSCGFGLYYDVMDCMAFGYFAINPIICFVFSSNYRQGLKRLMNSVRPSYRRKVQKSAGN